MSWTSQAIQTYITHPEHGNGYQWWSGIGSDIGEYVVATSVVASVVALYKHHQCGEPTCRRLGHAHPDHGQPVCREHYHSSGADPRRDT
jgi:hypothetical protein